ncbi:hypothetical protein GW17_00033413 [Ensete ventricosum]|nr:hypothetical protein GW17_00033413 [Ensete ventricosum]
MVACMLISLALINDDELEPLSPHEFAGLFGTKREEMLDCMLIRLALTDGTKYEPFLFKVLSDSISSFVSSSP